MENLFLKMELIVDSRSQQAGVNGYYQEHFSCLLICSRRYRTLNQNFGSPSYAISSGNTDGNGYGNFEYAVPSGYFALCTKNLAEYG